nr:phospholipase D-like domain-containing protein [Lactobacillus delbrueckii]
MLNTIRADAANGTDNAADILRRQYPELSADESDEISETIRAAMNTETADKVSLVVTAPPSFRIDAKPTMTVVRSMLEGAGRNILITGYSLSSYFSELTDTIIDKSQRGVFVKFFINNIEKQPDVDKFLRYKGRFLQIYDYSNEEDKMAALHAKVISVDMKQTLITSANLSYHGQQGNIELGALVESEHTAKQLDDVMTQLIFNKIFKQV